MMQIEPILDDIDSIRQIAISAKADTPEMRSLLRNMVNRIETLRSTPQIPLSIYNAVASLLSKFLDDENRLLLNRLSERQEAHIVQSLEQHIDTCKSQWEKNEHTNHVMRSLIEQACELLSVSVSIGADGDQLCTQLKNGLDEHLHDDALLRQEIEKLIRAMRASIQSINTLLRDIGDDASGMTEIEQMLEQKLPDDPKQAHALLQRTRQALLASSQRLSNISTSLQQAMQSQIGNIESIAQRLQLAEDQANKDSLTGLANRRHLGQFMSALEKGTVALLMVDIDHFKLVNDRYGHMTGDKVLTDAAALLATHVRSTDIAARFGGEEFCVVLPGASHDQAYTKAEALRSSIAEHRFHTDDGYVSITASIGVAIRRRGESIPHWTKRADTALYKAKQDGRNRVISAEVNPG